MKRFKNTSLAVTVLTMSVVGAGCNSSSPAPQSAPAQESAPAWALLYQTTCAAGAAADSCVGAYGFKVNADGTFQVGPGPQGQIVKGTLDSEDFAAVTEAAAGAIDGSSAATALSGESCNGYFGNVADYTLNIAKHGKKHELMHKTGGDLCSSELDAAAAEKLHNVIVDLSNHYYPTPFPDTCEEAAAAVQKLYAPLESCNVDADCAYLTANYTPVAADTIDTVYVDDCSKVAPLPAANRAAVTANLKSLQDALTSAQQACGVRIARDDCSAPKSFSSSAAPAVCQHGACKVNPVLGF